MARKTPPQLAIDYHATIVIGIDILWDVARLDPGAIADLGDIARMVIECAGKRAGKLSPRVLDELEKEARLWREEK